MKQTHLRDFIQSTELKRENFTLTNLVSKELDQYRSQHSTKVPSSSRPNTMYGQRIRILFNDENKKHKYKTETKRQLTSQHMGRATSTHKLKTTQDDKIRMKKCLGRINLLAAGELLLSREEETECIFDFLQCLSEIDNYYTSAFAYLSRKMKELVYVQDVEPFRELAEKTKDELLIHVAYKPFKRITYEKLCCHFCSLASSMMVDLSENSKSHGERYSEYEAELQEKITLITKLKRELKYYSEHPSKDLYPYIKQLEERFVSVEQQNDDLLLIKKENEFNLEIHQNTNTLLAEQVDALKSKIYQLEMEQLSGATKVEKNSELHQFEANLENLKSMLDKSKLKMEGMKEEHEKIKRYNEELISERSQLAKRAAVGFGELTPRPTFKKIFAEKQLDYDDFVVLASKNNTTENIVRQLVTKLKLIPAEKLKKKEEARKKYPAQQLQEFEIADEVMDYIDKTKEQIEATNEAGEEVRKAYNRQQKEKQTIEAAIKKLE